MDLGLFGPIFEGIVGVGAVLVSAVLLVQFAEQAGGEE